MKPLLAVQFLSPVFAAAIASPSSASVAEELAKKYDNHDDIDAAAASRAVPSRNLESIVATSSKSSKSSASCPPVPTPGVQCGNVYVNSTVILGQNLICTEAADERSTAVTLKGKKAVLDCQGYTISQETDSSTAALECPSQFETKECGLLYEYGVILEDGASIKNCNIQKFYNGAGIEDGGEIKNSEFSLNREGVNIYNFAANTVSKVANSKFYNNYDGLVAFQFKDNSKVMLEDVISKNNEYLGMYLTGTGITVNNANIKNNNNAGLEIGTNVFNEITLAGDITITNNKYGFYTDSFHFPLGTVHVTGNLISNHNEYGVATDSDITLVVGGSYSGKSGKSGSGSFTACDNTLLDINNAGGSTFEGTDYTCDTKVGTNLPECKPCPGCL